MHGEICSFKIRNLLLLIKNKDVSEDAQQVNAAKAAFVLNGIAW